MHSARPVLTAFALTASLGACQPGVVPPPPPAAAASPPPPARPALQVLAQTNRDPETKNPSYRVTLKWPVVPLARSFEVYRKLAQGDWKPIATLYTNAWTDTSLAALQPASYRVRVLDGEGRELATSEEKGTTVLSADVAAPEMLEPAAQAELDRAVVPTLRWRTVSGAVLYYVKVVKAADDTIVYSAVTREPAIRYAERSPLTFDGFAETFAVGNAAPLQRGFVYEWTVQAVRTDAGADPAAVKAVDLSPATPRRFNVL